MKKRNKILAGVGTIAAVVAPLAGVVSCGGSSGYAGRFDQVNDGKIQVITTWSKDGKQENAFKKQLDIYNALPTTKMKVYIDRIAGGYKSISPMITRKFEAGDGKTLPNLIFGYGDTLGSISKYDMELDMEMSKGSKDLRHKFEEKFVAENDQIGGIDGSKGTYIVPAAKSTDVENINKPLLGFLFHKAKEAGATLDAKIDTDFPMPTDPKLAALGKKWGKVKDADKTNKSLKNITIDETFFTDFHKMLYISTAIQGIFENAKKNGDLHVLGFDSVVNVIYMMTYAELGTKDLKDADSFIFNKGKDGYVHHDFFRKDGKAKDAFKKAYAELKPALDNGALYLNVGGAYASSLQVEDKIGLSIGSTAGYSHNYLKSGVHLYKLILKDGKKIALGYTHELRITHDTNAIAEYTNYGSTNYVVLKSKQKAFDLAHKPGRYSIRTIVDDSAKDILKGKESTVVMTSDINAKSSSLAIKIAEKDANYPKIHTQYILPKGSSLGQVNIETPDESEILIKNNLEIKHHPHMLNGKGGTFTFAQGPSVIGLHSNTEEDKATRQFMKWFTTKPTPTEKSPLEVFTEEADYITPTKGSFKDEAVVTHVHGKHSKYNAATAVAFNGFRASLGTGGRIFTNPADDTTSEMRGAIDSSVTGSYSQVNGRNGSAFTIEKIYQLIEADFNG